jgi:hypothetical protein
LYRKKCGCHKRMNALEKKLEAQKNNKNSNKSKGKSLKSKSSQIQKMDLKEIYLFLKAFKIKQVKKIWRL